MALKKFEKDSVEWQMFADYWEMCPKIVELLQDFRSKYKGKFPNNLIMALMHAEDANKDNIKPIFVDYWKLCQDVWEVEDNDSYWEQVIAETNDFHNKYKTEFSKRLALILTDKLETEHREKLKSKGVE